MSEKKIEENPLPEDQPAETIDKPKDTIPKPVPDKTTTVVPLPESKTTTTVPLPVNPPIVITPRSSMFKNASPHDLYRRLLPAMLFVLTFVTVMTMLLIYMDTVALGAQKFRANMSRDYELESIAQGSAALVAFVQQLHLAPRHALPPSHPPPQPTPQIQVMDKLYGEIYNGTFIEFIPCGPRTTTSDYLERARGWDGVLVRAAARDYLAIRGAARALHACLSPTAHPREVSYQEAESPENLFSSRVLCLPLFTVLLAADATRADYVVLGGKNALPALTQLPFTDERLHLQMIEVQFKDNDEIMRDMTTRFLLKKNYTVAASFDTSIMYARKGHV